MDAKHSSVTVVNRLSVGPVTHVRISGIIDETFSAQTFSKEMMGHVILDLGRVERISSFGVRRWIEFTGRLPPGAVALYIIHAPPLVMDQLNMVAGFAGVARVLSVLAPYSCTRCGEDRLRLVDLQAEASLLSESKAPPHNCPVCQSPLQFADLPAEFFDFARHQQLGQVEQVVTRYLRTLLPGRAGDPVELSAPAKLVHEDITYFRVPNVLRGDLNARRLASGLEGRVVYDFGSVASVEPEAGPKLMQIFETASESAKVFLWRVPPPVLLGLARTGQPLQASLATLSLPCECRNCGSKCPQRVEAAPYVKALLAGTAMERACEVCGGKARFPALRELAPFLSSATLIPGRLDEVEALEPRALSQYLAGAAAHEAEPQKAGTGNFSSLKLQILRRIGQGGMAEVFLAKQVGLKGFEKYVVVKKILENFAQQADFVEMLFAEARANARLTHQNIVQTFDVGLMNGVAYITMEYVRGPDVKKLLTLLRKAGERMPVQHALRIVAETAAGLHYAHSYVDPGGTPHPMVHRDVSPHNILLSLDGAIKLSDFGIAKVHGEAENTRPGTFKGKIAYLSPEAIAGQPVDARSDVFALGVTLFELLTGRLPFRRENEAATLHAIMREPAPNPTKLNPAIPEDLAALVLRSIEKDPARRIPSAGEFRDELETVMIRHQLLSSPTAVAQYFQERLGPQLADFNPVSGTGSDHNKSTPQPVAGKHTPAEPAAAAGGSRANRPAELEQRSGESRPSAGSGSMPAVAASRTSGSVARASATAPQRAANSQPSPKSQSMAAVGRPVSQSLRAVAAASPERAVAQQVAPEAEPPTPQASLAPARPPSTPMPAARANPAPALVVEAVRDEGEPSAPARRTRWVVGGAIAAIAVLAVVFVVVNGLGERLQVANLPADEHLYVSGIRIDPETFRPSGVGPLIVATAKDGKLYRWGAASRQEGIDVKALIIAPPQDQPSDMGSLSIRTQPSGCSVQVGSQMLPERTPTATNIHAGRELQVEVACDSYRSTHWVMAASGQTVDLTVVPPSP